MGWLTRRRRSGSGPRLSHVTRAAVRAARARAAAAGLEPDDDRSRRGTERHVVFRGGDAELAKRYLLDLPPVEERLLRYVVRTPDGTWGRDSGGLYLEALRPWQRDASAADCTGTVVAVAGLRGLVLAARGQGDNFIAEVACGRCEHEWYDGLRYQAVTAVRCPHCGALNGVDSGCVNVNPF
ncbi:hypothetical protein [Streptomyces buecherae]|uniref:hypothetical protein n=1 Tax=Streptomyces buecherae TaxID=2763006 RepID=UPI00364ADAE7